ncbi:MAG: GtrA family protein [Ottowia sp.]|nr:GtrA family protein [Ottowia sp.]
MAIPLIHRAEWLRRWFWFLFAGGTGFALYLLISNTLNYLLGVNAAVSAAVGTLLPVLPVFYMQHRLTFRSQQRKRKALPAYALLQVANAGFVAALTLVGVRLGLPEALVFVIAGAMGVVASYIVQSRLIFKAA